MLARHGGLNQNKRIERQRNSLRYTRPTKKQGEKGKCRRRHIPPSGPKFEDEDFVSFLEFRSEINFVAFDNSEACGNVGWHILFRVLLRLCGVRCEWVVGSFGLLLFPPFPQQTPKLRGTDGEEFSPCCRVIFTEISLLFPRIYPLKPSATEPISLVDLQKKIEALNPEKSFRCCALMHYKPPLPPSAPPAIHGNHTCQLCPFVYFLF
jgi:hypothetical protein